MNNAGPVAIAAVHEHSNQEREMCALYPFLGLPIKIRGYLANILPDLNDIGDVPYSLARPFLLKIESPEKLVSVSPVYGGYGVGIQATDHVCASFYRDPWKCCLHKSPVAMMSYGWTLSSAISPSGTTTICRNIPIAGMRSIAISGIVFRNPSTKMPRG